MRTIKFLFYLIILLVLTYFGLLFYVDYELSKTNYAESYNDCNKVWSSRGLYGDDIDQNSIESISAAFAEGAKGVKVDVRYDTGMKDFIVSEDFPYNKKNGELLKLSELFEAVGEENYFWLDFKKLRLLNDLQTQDAIQKLYDMSQQNSLYERLYVASEAPFKLAYYENAGLHTIFDSYSVPESKNYLSAFLINTYKIAYYFGNFSVMGMEYGDLNDPVFGPETREYLKHVPLFLYHVPENADLVDELMLIKSVRVMLVGSNESNNFHKKNTCQ